jgi:hypothetical protein
MVLFMKCVPWSLIRIFGHPNLVMMSSNMKHGTIVALQSLTTLALAHLVKYYIIVIMYLAPVHFLGGFIGPTKSMAHLSNAYRVSCGANDISSLLDGFPTLWHTLQAL